MPFSVASLLASAGASPTGAVGWDERLPTTQPGVYVVSVAQAATEVRAAGEVRFDDEAVEEWIARTPELRLAGRPATVQDVTDHLAQWWLPGESILYIGKATSLGERVRQYYRTPLGAARPHKGGYWLKTLADLPTLTVYYAVTTSAAEASRIEDLLLGEFVAGVTPPPRHPEPSLAMPFANLTLDRPRPRRRRQHHLTGSYPGR